MATDLNAAVKRALRRSRLDMLHAVRKWSSGRVSLAELRRMDHPFARRHGLPRLDPGLINRQAGEFLAGWRVKGPTADLVLSAENDVPHAAFLEHGTRFMFERPIGERVEAEVRPAVERHIREELERELR